MGRIETRLEHPEGYGISGITGSGAANQVAMFTNTAVIAGTSAFTYDGSRLFVTGDIRSTTGDLIRPDGAGLAAEFGNGQNYILGATQFRNAASSSVLMDLSNVGNLAIGVGATTAPQTLVNIVGANISGATAGYGVSLTLTAPSGFTAGIENFRSQVNTAAAAFTMSYAIAFSAANHSAGAGSAISRSVSFFCGGQSGASSNAEIADNLGFSGNYFIHSTNTNPSRLSGHLSINPGSGADVIGLSLYAGTTTGTVRNYWRNSDNSRTFEIDADFTGSGEQLVLQSDIKLLGLISRDGDFTIGGNGLTPTHRINCQNQSTVGAAGGASALPATPSGYLVFKLNGTTQYAIPYYPKS